MPLRAGCVAVRGMRGARLPLIAQRRATLRSSLHPSPSLHHPSCPRYRASVAINRFHPALFPAHHSLRSLSSTFSPTHVPPSPPASAPPPASPRREDAAEDDEDEDEDEDDEEDDDAPMLPIPTRSHPLIFPAAPLARVGFGSAPRPSLSYIDLTASLSSYLWRSGNFVELVRPHHAEVGDTLQRFVNEVGAESGERVLLSMSVSWRDVVEFIEEKRRQHREQQQLEQRQDNRKQRRERIRQQNLLNQQREEALKNGQPPPPPLPSDPLLPSSSPPSPSPTDSTPADESTNPDEELLPIHRLELLSNDEPIRFPSIDLFPYLHAYLISVLSQSSFSHMSLLILDDLDLLPASDLPLYLHQWFVALEQCVLAQRVQWYGVASSRIGRPRGAEGWVSVKELIATATGIVDRPHFAAIRFPLSVYDCSVVEQPNCELDGRPVSSMDYAKAKGLLCISEGLIDTVDAKGEERRLLSSAIGDGAAIKEELQGAMNAAMFLEKHFQAKSESEEAKEGRLEGARVVDRMEVSWAHVMAAQMPMVNNAVRWERVLDTVIQPALRNALTTLSASYPDEHPLARWAVDYRRVTNLLFSAFTHSVQHTAAHHSSELNAFLHDHCPALRQFHKVEDKGLVLALCVGVDVVSLCEVGMVALRVLKAAWKAEAKEVGGALEVSSEVEAAFPSNVLSREQALALMKKCREHFMDR